MRVICNKEILRQNIVKIETVAKWKGVSLAFLLKAQFHNTVISDVLQDKKNRDYIIYSTANQDVPCGAIPLYHSDDIRIVDAFEYREGCSLFEARRGDKNKAVVNFFCSSKRIPTDRDLSRVCRVLKKMGYRAVSLGGSMMLEYDFCDYDEIRVGEAFFTGYSVVFGRMFKGLQNPFTIEMEILKKSKDRIVVPYGLNYIGGFTCGSNVVVNTDLSVINNVSEKNIKNGYAILNPDYYTLLKLACNGVLQNATVF